VNCKFLNFGVKIEKPTKLQGLKVNFPQIIHILSPTAKITRQARKYREKTKTTKPTTQQQPSEQGEEESAGGANKKGNGEMRWRSTTRWRWQCGVTMGAMLRGTKREKSLNQNCDNSNGQIN
jgi:hypothetical protein